MKKTTKLLLGAIVIIIIIRIILLTSSTQNQSEFSDYLVDSEKISQDIFIGLESNIKLLSDFEEIQDITKLEAENNPYDNSLQSMYGIAIDEMQNKYYYNDGIWNGMDNFTIYEISLNDMLRSSFSLPYDKRWDSNSLTCFSCGCSCYITTKIIVSNEKYYMYIANKHSSNYIDKKRQGLYFWKEVAKTWIKLTPKTENDFKITNNGCSLAYIVNNQAYLLNVCGL